MIKKGKADDEVYLGPGKTKVARICQDRVSRGRKIDRKLNPMLVNLQKTLIPKQ